MFDTWTKIKAGFFLIGTALIIKFSLNIGHEDAELKKAEEILKQKKRERRKKRFFAIAGGIASLYGAFKRTLFCVCVCCRH